MFKRLFGTKHCEAPPSYEEIKCTCVKLRMDQQDVMYTFGDTILGQVILDVSEPKILCKKLVVQLKCFETHKKDGKKYFEHIHYEQEFVVLGKTASSAGSAVTYGRTSFPFNFELEVSTVDAFPPTFHLNNPQSRVEVQWIVKTWAELTASASDTNGDTVLRDETRLIVYRPQIQLSESERLITGRIIDHDDVKIVFNSVPARVVPYKPFHVNFKVILNEHEYVDVVKLWLLVSIKFPTENEYSYSLGRLLLGEWSVEQSIQAVQKDARVSLSFNTPPAFTSKYFDLSFNLVLTITGFLRMRSAQQEIDICSPLATLRPASTSDAQSSMEK